MHPNDEVLAQLDDLAAWSRTGPAGRGTITLLDYVGFIATPDAFFGFAALFWPDTLVHEGHVFLASRFEVASFDAWRDRGLELREIQRVMNHVHVSSCSTTRTSAMPSRRRSPASSRPSGHERSGPRASRWSATASRSTTLRSPSRSAREPA